jgi:hypothetical protein
LIQRRSCSGAFFQIGGGPGCNTRVVAEPPRCIPKSSPRSSSPLNVEKSDQHDEGRGGEGCGTRPRWTARASRRSRTSAQKEKGPRRPLAEAPPGYSVGFIVARTVGGAAGRDKCVVIEPNALAKPRDHSHSRPPVIDGHKQGQ